MAVRRASRPVAALLAAGIVSLVGSAADAPARGSEKPANNGQPTITGIAEEGQTLTGHNGSWFCNPACVPAGPENRGGYGFQWQRCDAGGSTCVDLAGATEQNYVVAPADRGSPLRVAVTATNWDCDALNIDCRYSSATAYSAVTAVVPGVPPAPPAPPPPPGEVEGPPLSMALPVAAGLAQEGYTLTASSGDWSGLLPLGFTYQWSRCAGPVRVDCTPIARATGATYAVAAADVGSTLRVTVTATNAVGAASATSEPTQVVVAIPAVAPAAMSAPRVFGRAKEGESLTAVPGSWSGSPVPEFAYDWLRCARDGGACLPVPDATGPVYVTSAGDGGHTLKVVVTATNRAGSASATSAPTPVIDPRGLVRLLDGRESAPAESVLFPDRLRLDRVRFARAPGGAVRGSFRVSDSRGYVVRGALVSLRPARRGAVSGAAVRATSTDGSVSLTFRVHRSRLGKRGTLVLFVQATKPDDVPSASVAARVRVTLRFRAR
jgi:hypothetical protein